ncbi:Ppx/GppA family phosphatase [Primorskyibacter flagellatus]|uniref:Exopolyphosphatase / guanosine-5'-triphosphate,3'-diphosphate pyrophosphatase n=1 Tax=Primorskyibacter flagellatus TaxID=1387277 RepID=A0A1W2BLS5_9RHOB|nr:Ppx/GppA family phosphatase [Primorskyibacter flagellatus]SMC73899.1 exopolyphosphatase / guanosine-5'-triphosphate,3'-diphosphate pyrophosphatase [Primorskyibacter flagellatus]
MTKLAATALQVGGPFARPLFDDPESRDLSRVGVLDIGSNSVRLVVFDGAARSPAYFYNEKLMCALGAGMSETGRLNPEGRKRALSAIIRFQTLANGLAMAPISAVATAAVREAEDGADFCAEVEAETGLKICVIDGEEEARLSAQGVLLGWPGSYGLVCDIGGSSMELAEIARGHVGRRTTSPLGPLKLRDIPGGAEERKDYIRKTIKAAAKVMGPQHDRLFLVGGSWRAIARIDMDRLGYPLHVLHEYRMDAQSIAETLAYIAASDLEKLRSRCSISSARMSLVPYAAEVLGELIGIIDPKDIAISSYGIREGLLYEQMPQRLRDRDPLIEACYFAEAKDARLPGFGRRLFAFVAPLFPTASEAQIRIVKAACLLNDVSWRAHPDYRAETCFDNATRANLGGLKHAERIFLGLALLHRYRNKREGTRFEDLYDLIEPEQRQEAEVLGKAMRFGSMLWMSDFSATGAEMELDTDAGILTLRLSGTARLLFGEVAEARFKSLASSLGVDTKVVDAAS